MPFNLYLPSYVHSLTVQCFVCLAIFFSCSSFIMCSAWMMTPSIKAKCSSEVKWRVPLEICEPFVRIESKQKAKTYHTVILTKNCINIFILLLHSLRERQTGNRKVGVVYYIAVVNEINVDNRQMNRIPNAMWRAHSIVFVLLLVYC